jgi:hypothetical protein
MNGDRGGEDFERRARALLDESVSRVDARVRSRLSQLRHAALEEAARAAGMPAWLRGLGPLPVVGAVAAATVVALILWSSAANRLPPFNETVPPVLDDFEIIADGEALELLEEWDGGFYEWAAAQGQNAPSSG